MNRSPALTTGAAQQRIYRMVLAGLLCAIGILIPMIMPKIAIGPASMTLASHVPVFIGMLISPAVALAVCIGTTLGFFLTTSPLIALRALSHVVFAMLGARYLTQHPTVIRRPLPSLCLSAVLALVHAVFEVLAVTPFFLMGAQFPPEQLANGFFYSVVLLIGAVAVIHSMIDYGIAMLIWKPLRRVLRPDSAAV